MGFMGKVKKEKIFLQIKEGNLKRGKVINIFCH